MKTVLFLLAILASQANSWGQDSVQPLFDSFSDFPKIRDFALSSNQNEAYITVQSPLEEVSVLVSLSKVNKQWTKSEILAFSGKYKDLEPFLSPDNLRLYFASNRPKDNSSDESGDFDIWYVERETLSAPWGTPINIGPSINSEHNEFYPSLSANKNIYFTSDRPGSIGKDDLYFSQWENNEYTAAFSLGDSVNTEGFEFNTYVSPDESYLIFSGYNREDGVGSGDLYISYRDEKNQWSKAKNMGNGINSRYMDYCPFVDNGTMTLYFTSRRSAVTSDHTLQSMDDLIKEINQTENGKSTIYSVSIKDLLLEHQ